MQMAENYPSRFTALAAEAMNNALAILRTLQANLFIRLPGAQIAVNLLLEYILLVGKRSNVFAPK
jgi:hypothetical protein